MCLRSQAVESEIFSQNLILSSACPKHFQYNVAKKFFPDFEGISETPSTSKFWPEVNISVPISTITKMELASYRNTGNHP